MNCKRILTVAAAWTLALCACTAQEGFRLTVSNGYGSGIYKAGDLVRIWAKEFAEDSVFKGWGQSIKMQFIVSPREWNTQLVMPGTDVEVEALFDYAAPLRWEEADIRVGPIDKHVWYSIPNNPRALITLHHFTNGRGKLWTERTEYKQFCHAAAAMGYGLLAYNCDEVDRGPQDDDKKDQWKAFPASLDNNPDHRFTRALLDSLLSRNIITSATPLFAVGMSVGGSYTLSVAKVLGFQAWVNFCSGGPINIADSTTVPGIQAPAINDANADDAPIGENNIKARQVYERLLERGIACEWMQNHPQPLYPQRFARIKGIGLAKSAALFRQIKDRGFLDSSDIPKIQGDTLEYAIENFPNAFDEFGSLSDNLRKEVLFQYRVAYADHEFHSNFTFAILNFFENIIQKTTHVESPLPAAALRIAPNPATDVVSVQLPESQEPVSVELSDALGRRLAMLSANSPSVAIPLSAEFGNGVYMLRVRSGNVFRTAFFVVQR